MADNLSGYVTTGLPANYYTGTMEVTNRPLGQAVIAAYSQTVTYAGELIAVDKNSLFVFGTGCGEKTFSIVDQPFSIDQYFFLDKTPSEAHNNTNYGNCNYSAASEQLRNVS